MTLHVFEAANVARTVGQVLVHDSGAWVPVSEMWVHDAGDWRLVYQAGLSLAVFPPLAQGYSSLKAGPFSTNAVTVNVAGGTPPYTHSWSIIEGGPFSISAPTSGTTQFIGTPPSFEGELVGTAQDTVHDANGLFASITEEIILSRGAL